MSRRNDIGLEWLDGDFRDWLDRLQAWGRRIEPGQEWARHRSEPLTPAAAEELRRAWRQYTRVIAQLEETGSEFQALRTGTD